MKPITTAVQKAFKKSLSRMALASLLGTSALAWGHGQPVNMVPLVEQMKQIGADVKEDTYGNLYTITKGSTYVRVKLDADTVMVNGKALKISAPVVLKNGQVLAADTLANEIFQSGLDQTFKVETTPHPLNSLSADEISAATRAIKQSKHALEDYRFSDIRLLTPDKDKVWQAVMQKKAYAPVRKASFTLLQRGSVIEGVVNLKTQAIERWTVLEKRHGMVLLDDFENVQIAIHNSPEYAAALKRRGITDVTKAVATPLTVGYFGKEDEMSQDMNILKVVSYLDVGDGNYWAHPIENVVAVVDLHQKKVIKVDDGEVVAVPRAARPYDGRDRVKIKDKPLDIIEPEGKNYTITGRNVAWGNWRFHISLDSRVGLQLGTVTYSDKGKPRKVMYQGSLGGMVVPYGDPDMGWYFKSYLDSGEYGMGTLTSPMVKGKDAPANAVFLDAVIPDHEGKPVTVPNAMAIFERYAGPEFKHQEMGAHNVSTERRELVVRWVSTIGNYDYIFDWVFAHNGIIGINAGATGIEAVKGVKARTMADASAKEDTRFGTLIDHNIVGTTHQHIYNFRLDMDVDEGGNTLTEVNPIVAPNTRGGPRTTAMELTEAKVTQEAEASQRFDPSTIRLISNYNKANKVGNPVSYQLIPFAGGTHPIAKGANFGQDEWLFKRLNFMDKQIWVTRYHPDELYPEGTYPNRSGEDTGLAAFIKDNQNIDNKDLVVWLTTGTTHVARAEEWPIMPTEWVNVLLKPWNFFNETPTLDRE